FQALGGGPRQRGHFPPKCKFSLKKLPRFAISSGNANAAREPLDVLSQNPLSFDKGYSDKLSKKKYGADSHLAVRAIAAGNGIRFGGTWFVQSLLKGKVQHIHPPHRRPMLHTIER